MARRSPASEEEARRDIAAVDTFLAQGFPAISPSGDTRTHSAAHRAAETYGIDRMTFLARVGTPDVPGSHFHRFGLRPDWGIAAARGELDTEPVLPGFAITSTSTQRGADGALIHPDLWTRAWIAAAQAALDRGAAGVVAEDCRFENEAAAVRAMGGRVVRILRFDGGVPRYADASEAGLSQVEAEIRNDGGLAALYADLDALVAELARRAARPVPTGPVPLLWGGAGPFFVSGPLDVRTILYDKGGGAGFGPSG